MKKAINIQRIISFLLCSFISVSAISPTFASANTSSLLEKIESWKDNFYNPSINNVIASHPILHAIVKLLHSISSPESVTTIEITATNTINESVYLTINKTGHIVNVSAAGEAKIEGITSMEIIDSLLSALNFPDMKQIFYEKYDNGLIEIKTTSWKDYIKIKIMLMLGRLA